MERIELREYKTPLELSEFVLVDGALCPKEELLVVLLNPLVQPLYGYHPANYPAQPRAVIQIKHPTHGIAAVRTASEK